MAGESMMAELERLLNGVGVNGPKESSAKGEPKTSTWSFQDGFLASLGILELFQANVKAFQGLATEDDLLYLRGVYCEYFAAEDAEDGPPIPTQDEAIATGRMQDSGGEDLGIGEESGMDLETLASQLGFIRKCLPIQFNTHRHRLGLTPWSDSSDFDNQDPSNSKLTPLSLHWHQLAGVHSIVRSTFTPEPEAGNCTGMLVCDEVGLGKTTLVISAIAFLNQALSNQENGSRPPILGEYPQR